MNEEQSLILLNYENYLITKNYTLRGIEEKLRIAGSFFEYLNNHEIELSAFDPESYRKYLKQLTNGKKKACYAPKTVVCIIATLKPLFNFLVMEGKVVQNPFVKDKKILLQQYTELIKGFKKYLSGKNYKPRGIEEKLRVAKYFFEYIQEHEIELYTFNFKQAEIYREHLRLLVNDKQKAQFTPQTINGMIANLKLFFRFLAMEGKTAKNAFTEIGNMRTETRLPKNILSVKQMGKFLGSIEVRDKQDFKFKVLTELLYCTGARISEIEALCFTDIHLEAGYIMINDDKERQNRKAVLSEYCTGCLKLYLKYIYDKNEKFIFRNAGYKKRSINTWMNNRLAMQSKKLKFPKVSCHCIRHITATHLFKNQADIREVQEYLGHKRIKNTEKYTHIFPDDLKNIVEKSHPREVEFKKGKGK